VVGDQLQQVLQARDTGITMEKFKKIYFNFFLKFKKLGRMKKNFKNSI